MTGINKIWGAELLFHIDESVKNKCTQKVKVKEKVK